MSVALARMVGSALAFLEDCQHRGGQARRGREPLVCSRCVAKAREVLRAAKKISDAEFSEPAQHGVTCRKALHVGTGHMHGPEDDGPYDVDGQTYCGRCHGGM